MVVLVLDRLLFGIFLFLVGLILDLLGLLVCFILSLLLLLFLLLLFDFLLGLLLILFGLLLFLLRGGLLNGGLRLDSGLGSASTGFLRASLALLGLLVCFLGRFGFRLDPGLLGVCLELEGFGLGLGIRYLFGGIVGPLLLLVELSL